MRYSTQIGHTDYFIEAAKDSETFSVRSVYNGQVANTEVDIHFYPDSIQVTSNGAHRSVPVVSTIQRVGDGVKYIETGLGDNEPKTYANVDAFCKAERRVASAIKYAVMALEQVKAENKETPLESQVFTQRLRDLKRDFVAEGVQR